MTKNNERITTSQIYELVDKKIGEVNESIQKLDEKFTRLEEGRLSSLETKVANFEGKVMATTGIISFAISIALGIVGFMLKKQYS